MFVNPFFINIAYLITCVTFILGIKNLNKPTTARKGTYISIVGMVIALVVVYFENDIARNWSLDWMASGFLWTFVALIIGSIIGAVWSKKVKMTGMPELVALYNGFGGLASAFAAFSQFYNLQPLDSGPIEAIATGITIFIGALCFSGSMLAWAKLAAKISGRAIVFKGQNYLNLVILAGILAGMVVYTIPGLDPGIKFTMVIIMSILSLIFGVTFVLPIGGGDMPVVISLLNSFTGLAVAAAGFLINNTALIVTGCLVGASGVILTLIMCKAMNRSIRNLLFSGFGAVDTVSKKGPGAEPKSISVEDAYMMLEAARTVVIIPGYGMAVAQAQHVVKELAEKMEANGTEVSYAIHPVAGRMPGHMNVLLAEADVPYEQLKTMAEMNPVMPTQDVAIVIGANDTVNPAAENDKSAPMYGMPIVKAYQAKTVFVLKRGKGRGFSGIENELFSMPNTLMIYGDAKATLSSLAGEFTAE